MVKSGIPLLILVAAYLVLSIGMVPLESGVETRSGFAPVNGAPAYCAEWGPGGGSPKSIVVLLHRLGACFHAILS